MNSQNFLLIILGGGFFVGTFISILLFFKQGKIHAENRFLGIVVFLCSINLVHPHLNLILGINPGLKNLGLNDPVQFLVVPLVWLYIRNHLKGNFKLKINDFFHFIPFVVVLFYLVLPLSTKLEALTIYPLSSILLRVFLIVQSVLYMQFSVKLILTVRKELGNQLSSFKGMDLKWIQSFFHMFVVLYFGYFAILFALVHFNAFQFVRIALSISFMFLIWILGFRALNRREPIPAPINIKSTPPLSNLDAEKLKELLEKAMENDRLYLNPELTLNDLAEKLKSSRNEISWVLNQSIGKNFYNYVNEYRVEEVIALMKDKERDHQKLLALAFDAGFNSKPAFNAIFKKVKGQTPSEYRKKLI